MPAALVQSLTDKHRLMLEIIIVVAAVLVVFAVPSLRRAALSFLGLVAIIAAGSAIVAVVVWGLYQAKPWVAPDEPTVAEVAEVPGAKDAIPGAMEEADLTAAIESEEVRQQGEEQQRLEAERARIADVAARARAILEGDRLLAEQAAAYPLPAGVGSRLGSILAIRIPAWRDGDVAVSQQESIRAWLQSIGLTAEETVSITTAKAWGGLHDMWVAETTGVAAPSLQVSGPAVAADVAAPGPGLQPESEVASETGSSSSADADSEGDALAEADAQPETPPIQAQPIPRRTVARRSPPRRAEPQRAPPPRRQRPAQSEVGPFGY